MSYILDALRRAEAERERGQLPGLHTQPVAISSMAAAPVAPRPALLWTGALAALLLLGALLWWLLPRSTPHEPVVLAASPQDATAPVTAPPAPPPAAAVITPAEAVKVVPVMPVPAPHAASASAPTGTAASSAAPVPAIVPWDRLHDSQRRQLPALAIGGAIWSESAANRMLIVSGQLLHEGDTAAPGVVLEQIRAKSAVLRWKDLRYEVSF
jgi:general secretion pathway protein B